MVTEEEKSLDLLLHPVTQGQDSSCPDIEWMGEDLGQCPGVGEWKCMNQEDKYGDLLCGGGSENLDYKPCNCANHDECPVYKQHHE